MKDLKKTQKSPNVLLHLGTLVYIIKGGIEKIQITCQYKDIYFYFSFH